MKSVLVLLLGIYACGLMVLGRGIVNEDWDGIKSINNALLATGHGGSGIGFDGKRPPAGWLLTAPLLSAAYRAGGNAAALKACRCLMPCFLAGLLWVCGAFFLRLFSPAVACLLVLLMALNPILIQFAPFALFDIFSALAVIPFLWAAYRYLERPGARRYWVLAAAYAAAFLSKYHLGLLILVPLACLLFDRGFKRCIASPLWLLPAICWGAAVLFLGGILYFLVGGRWAREAWLEAHSELWSNFFFNVMTPKPSHWHLYLAALWRQLDFGLFGLMLCGVWAWLSSGKPLGRFLAISLLIPAAGLCFAIANKEARYAIPLLPLVYAAIGQGLEFLSDRFHRAAGARRALLAFCLLAVPWNESLAAARYLLEEPSIHTEIPWRMAGLVEAAVPRSGCAGWLEGDLIFPIEKPLYRYEPALLMGGPTFRFFSRRTIKEIREGSSDGTVCDPVLMIVPKQGPSGPRWEDAAAAKAFRMDPRKLLWEVYPDHIQEAP